MYTRHVPFNLHFGRKFSLYLLAFFTFIGSYVGVSTAHLSDTSLLPLMRMTITRPVSIVGLIVITLLPFLITSIALMISKPFLLLPVSFFKSFLYTLLLCSVNALFASGGWLVCTMLLFSNAVVQFWLYWFWIRHINGFRSSAVTDLVICIGISFIFSVVDYFVISPFLVYLMNT